MAMKPSNIWIRRQQCPCGDWKCYVKPDGDDQASASSRDVKVEAAAPSSSSEAVFSPYVGQIFGSDDAVFEYYSSFARKNGFSIRKARSTESQNLGVYRRDFVCYRSGFNQPRKKANVEHQRERKSVRCGCDAKLYLTKEIVDGVTQWYVSQFSNVHNHELLEDDQVRLLPAYRKIHEVDQERILLLSKAGFPVNRILKVFELEKGVQPGNLPFIEKDVRNFIRSCKRSVQENDAILNEKRETEMLELIEALKATAERDPDFVYDFTTDEDEKLENISWTFGNSVRVFTMFGDVITFDTSYSSINYGLVLGVWFGIDNHGKPILLGCVLLQDESTHSLSWALQSFVRSMRGAYPQTILTDMDSGLKESISRELTNTKHVIGLWHVLSKISSWFSPPLGSRLSDFKADFDMLCRLENMEEFEHHWNLLAPRYGLASDRHIELLHSHRAYWPFCCSRSCFLARMMTPEFSHSLESFLKRILSGQICLQVFFEQVNIKANSTIVIRERTQYLHIKTCMPMEEHARTILSPYAFRLLQDEIVSSLQYGTTEMERFVPREALQGNGGRLSRSLGPQRGADPLLLQGIRALRDSLQTLHSGTRIKELFPASGEIFFTQMAGRELHGSFGRSRHSSLPLVGRLSIE